MMYYTNGSIDAAAFDVEEEILEKEITITITSNVFSGNILI